MLLLEAADAAVVGGRALLLAPLVLLAALERRMLELLALALLLASPPRVLLAPPRVLLAPPRVLLAPPPVEEAAAEGGAGAADAAGAGAGDGPSAFAVVGLGARDARVCAALALAALFSLDLLDMVVLERGERIGVLLGAKKE